MKIATSDTKSTAVSSGIQRASAAHPCAICGKAKDCYTSSDSKFYICFSEAAGSLKKKVNRAGRTYFLHPGPLFEESKQRGKRSAKRKQPATAAATAVSVNHVDAALSHAAYQIILQSPLVRLTDEHRAALRQRGLTDEQIEAAQYRSVRHSIVVSPDCPSGEWEKIPGFLYASEQRALKLKAPARGILIPCRDRQGRIVKMMLRKDHDPKGNGKYCCITSATKGGPSPGNPIHYPLGTPAQAGSCLIVEGILKADVTAALSGWTCVGVNGIGDFLNTIPALKAMKTSTAILAFDADARSNRSVAAALRAAVAGLRAAGFIVHVAHWPGACGKGIDDVLASGHRDQIGRAKSIEDVDKLVSEICTAAGVPAESLTTEKTTDAVTAKIINEADPDEQPDLQLLCSMQGRTDLENARRFVRLHGENARFCPAWNCWLIWNGMRWEVDQARVIQKLANDISDHLWRSAKLLDSSDIHKFAAYTASSRGVECLLKMAAPLLPVRVDELDQHPLLLNTRSGIVDLQTGAVKPHDRNLLLTQIIPHRYHADAAAPRWEAFLQSIFGSNADLVQCVRMLLGYSMTGIIRDHILPIWHGTGRNGKSVLLGTMLHVMGDYALQAPPDLLLQQSGEKHPTILADLHRRRFVACSETPEGKALDESLAKSLTGNDTIRARRMRQDFYSFTPTHKLALLTNHKPRIKTGGDGLWRRLMLIPFTVSYWSPDRNESGPEEFKQDPHLLEKLKAESVGILAWLVTAARDWHEHGLYVPEAVRLATSDYETNEDSIGQFIDEACLVRDDYRIACGKLHAAYVRWTEDRGEKPRGIKNFGEAILAKKFNKKKSGCWWWEGITTNAEMDRLMNGEGDSWS